MESQMFRTRCSEADVQRQMFRAGCSEADVQSQMFRAGCSEADVQSQMFRVRCGEPDVQSQMWRALLSRMTPTSGWFSRLRISQRAKGSGGVLETSRNIRLMV